MANYRIISSDNHVMEPADLWTDRVEAKFRDRAPRVVRMEDGTDWWVCDGIKIVGAFAATQSGVRFEEPEKLSIGGAEAIYENVRLGGYIPEEHIKDMDIDGIDISIVYPTVGLLIFGMPDSEFVTSLFRTYNDWVAEFCSGFPRKLKGIAMLNIDDVQTGIKELERCVKLGFTGAMISVYPPEERSYDSPEYEPLWAAAEDLQIPLGLHAGTNRPSPGQEFQSLEIVKPGFFTNLDHWVRLSVVNMIFSGVFERHPKLQIGSIEMELAWVPHFLDRMDFTYTQRQVEFAPYRFKDDRLPSDFFHSNVFLGFQEDALGIRDRHIIGVDNLLWGADYPHTESTFPRSQEIIADILADCTEEEKAKIVGENSARIYHLD